MLKPLEKEFAFYLKCQDELVKKYNGKFLVIKDEEIIGVYNSQVSAYTETARKHEVGTFLIQFCSPGKENITQTFNSRVTFA